MWCGFGDIRWRVGLVLFAVIACSGCTDMAQEDRSVEWSNDGRSAGFQHGRDGLFVTDESGSSPRKIYTPDKDVLATSTPLWSPDGQRVLFTTAKKIPDATAETDEARPRQRAWDENPEGRWFGTQPVTYTCWLSENAKEDNPPPPRQLFRSKCDHAGYVAANLAVRWHPDGQRVLYVEQADGGKHGVFEFELTNGNSRKVFPHPADRILFDWSPDGAWVSCVVSNVEQPELNGIWIGNRDYEDWWQIPQSIPLIKSRQSTPTETRTAASLQQMRQFRPVWQRAGGVFAYKGPVAITGKGEEEQIECPLMRVNAVTRQVAEVHSASQLIVDVKWSADGSQLGFSTVGDDPSVFWLDAQGVKTGPINQRVVRRFLGWNSSGERFAYTSPVPTEESDGAKWAVLFRTVPDARDELIIAGTSGQADEQAVMGDMRITFAQWSPTDEKISLWATFVPRYQSWWSRWFRWGLRPGDPAAILDVDTGAIEWMPVTTAEKIQVGHYYLLRREYAKASEWYTTAELERAKQAEPRPLDILFSQENDMGFELMHSICLSKLGREQEAAERLAQFRALWRPTPDDVADEAERRSGVFDVTELRRETLLLRILEESYLAEVFLNFGIENDGVTFLETEMSAAVDDETRLSRAVVLTQLLLRQGRLAEYCRVAADEVIPLTIAMVANTGLDEGTDAGNGWLRDATYFSMAASMIPLYSQEFLTSVADEALSETAAKLEAIRQGLSEATDQRMIDRALMVLYKRLRDDEKTLAVRERNPMSEELDASKFVEQFNDVLKRIGELQNGIETIR